MTNGQERDLRDAFERALLDLRAGKDIAYVENAYSGQLDSAVIAVIGADATPELLERVDQIIEKWSKGTSK